MATYNNLPTGVNAAIQTGLLDHTFRKALTARLGFRSVAERMDFPGQIGQTITMTKPGLLPAVSTPLSARTNTDLTDGLTAAAYPLEQYTIGIDSYAQTMNLQLASAAQAIDSLYLHNAYALGESASRSLDAMCYQTLMDSYLGYQTYVVTTLGSPGTTIAVDDVRGFFETVSATTGKVVPTSASNPIVVLVNGVASSLQTVVADGVAPVLPYRFNNLSFLGSSTNTSKTPGGFSGTLTFAANVLVANGTAGNSVVAAIASPIIRPNSRANASKLVAGDVLNMAMVRRAMTLMRANGINGELNCYTDDITAGTLMADTEFRQYLQGQSGSQEFRNGQYARIMGVNFITSNMPVTDTTTLTGQNLHRSIIVADGALLEADFTTKAYANAVQDDVSMVSVVDNVAHVTRPPINYLSDVVAQTWASYIGFCCPTDTTANPTVLPTASNAARKRAIVLESVEV